ncbi:hypothetical protein ABK040_006461 [Willaertia magna]
MNISEIKSQLQTFSSTPSQIPIILETHSFLEIISIILDNLSFFTDFEIKQEIIPFTITSFPKDNCFDKFCKFYEYIISLQSTQQFSFIILNLLIPILQNSNFYKNILNDINLNKKKEKQMIDIFIKLIVTLPEKLMNIYFLTNNKRNENNFIKEDKNNIWKQVFQSKQEDDIEIIRDRSMIDNDQLLTSDIIKFPLFFHFDNYIPFILEKLINEMTEENNLVFIEFILQFTKRGNVNEIVDFLIYSIFIKKRKDLIFKIISLISDEKVLKLILHPFIVNIVKSKKLTKTLFNEIIQYFSKQIKIDILWYQLFTNSFIFGYLFAEKIVKFNEFLILRIIIDSITISNNNEEESSNNNNSRSIISVTDFISSVWKKSHFIIQSNDSQQLFVTYCLVLLISNLNKKELENSETLKNCIEGIHQRLHSTFSHVRESCSLVALQFSKIINTSEKPLILFDEYKERLSELEDKVKHCLDDLLIVENVDSNEVLEMNNKLINNTESKKEKKEKVFNPNELLFNEEEEDDEESTSDEENALSETDSVESLQSLDMSDDEKNDENPYRPLYLRDLIEFLFANDQDKDQMFKIDAAIKHAADVIDKSDPKQIQLLGAQLCNALLTCSEPHLTDFYKNKLEAMVTLLTRSCLSIIDLQADKTDQRSIDYEDEVCVFFLTNKFWSNQITQAQRLDILSVLSQTALRLSNHNIDGNENKDNQKTEQNDLSTTNNNNKKPEYIPVYPNNTRRWGSSLNKKQAKKTNQNYFLLHANRFYYLLLRTKRQVSETIHILFSEDSLLLSKLLHTIGIFIYCCGSNPTPLVALDLIKNSIEFIWGLILYSNVISTSTQLRASILNTLITCIDSSTSVLLTEELLIDVNALLDWLMKTCETDSDLKCRELARLALSSFSKKINNK